MALLAGFALLAGAGVGCSKKEDASAAGKRRIVVLGGPLTEIIFALGFGDEVVGVDASSVYPDQATQLDQVGYFRHFSAEGVIGLGPTLVVHSDGAGPKEALAQIQAAGIETFEVADPEDFEGARARVEIMARALGAERQAAEILARFDADMAAAEALREQTQSRPRVLFLYARGADTLLVGGRDTVSAVMITAAGGRNAVDAFADFRPLSAESVVAAAPEVLLVPERGLVSVGGIEGLRGQPGLAETPALKQGRVLALDDLALLGLGPRTGETLMTLIRGLHPELEA
ncbi:ABC transporter substrate-binding protein [Pseudenhygromyxa sp. WMMC2535]|uniref:heme/hemin ABC transporter substrate-binding protein n=1 Tax=Pseudenhygromyxa sp. WMMC2535 TaxID=2712867 RepID=UPI0015551647|nr:ABC transporter substrate-binding protein [Pseudenhygromyxa sp. WMMC2535]NVB39886.1 ABC transporter substrate-binding protein [Pseudenhygromyxa sp. WMMC2535]